MKSSHKVTRSAAVAVTALLSCLALSPSAHAQLVLRYEENFGTHTAGQAFSGPFRINLQNFDNATIYPSVGAPGSAAGFGANGTGVQTVAGGINTLDGIQAAGATGAALQPTTINGVNQPGSSSVEDSWGIARILTITDLDGGVVWSETGKNQQLTTMFYGAKDFYVNQLANGFQEIDAAGLHVDLYLQNKSAPGFTPYNPFLGSGGRTSPSTYASVTSGFKILSTVSTAGFINAAGTLGGLATEFSSIYNNTSGGTGQTYLSVTGGTDAALFHTNFYASPFIPGVTADLLAQFTTVINNSTADWLVRSNDPVSGKFTPVPEPSTYGLAAVLALIGIVGFRRRQSKSAC
jgi:hypothetical protein